MFSKSQKSLTVLIVFLLSATCIFAQGKKQHYPPLEELIELSDAQVDAIHQIKTITKTDIQAIRQNETIPTEDKTTRIKEIRLEQKEAIKNLLTPEQIHELAALKKEKKKTHSAIKKEIAAYKKTNIEPIMLRERKIFEQYIDKEDKNTIAEIRRLRNQFWADKKAELAAKKKENTTTKPLPKRKKDSATKTPFFQAHPEHLATTRGLLKKYEVQLKQVAENIDEESKIWYNDMKQIKEKHLGELNEHHQTKRKERPSFMKASYFLLLDTDENFDDPIAINGNIHQAKIFPNPAQEFQILEFHVKTAGLVKINLVDKNGVIVQTLLEDKLEAGLHQIEINTTNLNKYLYYYQIQNNDGQSSLKTILNQE